MADYAAAGVRRWHTIFEAKDADAQLALLDQLLDDGVVFHSPVLHRPVEGKLATAMYLQAAARALVNPNWRYVRQLVDEAHAVLEFVTEVDGIVINGVDMMTFDAEGRIVDFKVLVRPMKAVEKLKALMLEALADLQRG